MASTSTIAHFSRWRLAAYLLFNLALCAAMGTILYRHPEKFERPFVVLGCVAVPILIIQMLSIFRKILSRGLVAAWIEDGKFHYLDSYWGVFFSGLPETEIVSATIGSQSAFRPDGIILKLSEGGRDSIRHYRLSESNEVLRDRLTDALRLQNGRDQSPLLR